MGTLSKLIPTNILEQKQLFLESTDFNPQFIYEEALTKQELTQHGLTKPEFVELSKLIVEKAYANRNEQDLWMMEGQTVSQKEVDKKIGSFLSMHGLEDRFKTEWSSSFITRASVYKDTIKLRLPVFFRREGLLSMVYHEVGTHVLRRVNYERQPWYKKKKAFGFGEYLETEEGLASLNGLFPRTFSSAHNTALRYLAVDRAQTGSFLDVWNFLKPYVQDEDRRWEIVFRQKRGLSDTSKPGGFSKDLTYFEGMIKVWRWLEESEFDITPLYFGKLALGNIPQALEINPNFKPLLPSFFTLDPKAYAKKMQAIGKFNYFSDLAV
jgi:hypothetical protein